MNEEQIEYSIKTNELMLSNWDKFNHYGIVSFLIFIPTVFIFLHLKDYFLGKPYPINGADLLFSIIPLLLAYIFYRIQKNRLQFKVVETNLTRYELDKIIQNVAVVLKWAIQLNNNKIILAKTSPKFFSGSWGEQITILFDNNKVLINSICDLNKRRSVISMGRNKENMDTLINEIRKVSH